MLLLEATHLCGSIRTLPIGRVENTQVISALASWSPFINPASSRSPALLLGEPRFELSLKQDQVPEQRSFSLSIGCYGRTPELPVDVRPGQASPAADRGPNQSPYLDGRFVPPCFPVSSQLDVQMLLGGVGHCTSPRM